MGEDRIQGDSGDWTHVQSENANSYLFLLEVGGKK